MRIVTLVVLLAGSSMAAGEEWHRVVGLLQYLEGDYEAALASRNVDELAEQRGFAEEVVHALKDLGPTGAVYLERALQLQADIAAERAGKDVVAACHQLAADIVQREDLVRAPRAAPSLEAGRLVFQEQCASCHGAEGLGDGPASKAMTPPPANFHDVERMKTLSPYKVFNTTTFGIKGTPMPGFPSMKESDRWNVAFFVFGLRRTACAGFANALSIEQLATTTDEELAKLTDSVPCARAVMPVVSETQLLGQTVLGLEEARVLANAGKWDEARKAVVDAYLLGLEPLEPTLRARNPDLVERLEKGFTQARLAAQRHEGFEGAVAQLIQQLKSADTRSRGDFWSVFFAALFILLREGFEATVVVGALLAVMKKMGADTQVKVVHAGWVSALVFGVIAFIFGQALLAGANREWLETVVALGAVGLLLYAALWLNARSNVSAFMGDMRAKMKDALGRGSTVGLFVVSFTSVGRETVETALFLQGLAGDSRDGVLWGSMAGGLLLVVLVLIVRTVGFRLPMKALFDASTVLLIATAVMLLGKGLHGLQELGVMPLAPISFVSIEPLGIFPDVFTVLPQLLLAVAPLVWWFARKGRTRSSSSAGASRAVAD